MFRDKTVKMLFLIALAGSLMTSWDLYIFGNLPLATAFRQGIFTAISGLCTSGLQNSDPHHWVAIPIAVVAMMMFIGGAMGSAAGGIKVNRVMLAYEGVKWWFRRFFVSSHVLVPFRFGGQDPLKGDLGTGDLPEHARYRCLCPDNICCDNCLPACLYYLFPAR